MPELKLGPRIGGANLECFMLAGQGLAGGLSRLIPQLVGLTEISSPALRVEEGEFQYTDVPDLSRANLMTLLSVTGWRAVELRVRAVFYDVAGELTVTAYQEFGIVVVSTLEDMIWGYGESVAHMNFARLTAFTDLCRRIADELDISCAMLGSEPCLPSEFATFCNQSDRSPACGPEQVFSKNAILKLYEWYRDEYASRWR